MIAAGPAVPPSGVLGGGVLKADDYAGSWPREYLAGYLPAGGAAVKVAVVGGTAARRTVWSRRLATAAAEHSDLFVRISAESARVHMIDQIFFAISRVVDWEAAGSGQRPGRLRRRVLPGSGWRRAHRGRDRPPP